MNVFVTGIGNVSPQNTLDNEAFLTEIRNEKTTALWCIEPDYKSLLVGVNLRRMSRLLKQAVYSAKLCMNDAECTELDAIITGTGLGFTQDTEKFLTGIYKNNEGIISPTLFIQSTHNVVSAKIALLLNCENYNFTYANKGASFESALIDGMMQINENCSNVLVGGFDELTENYLKITNRMKLWKSEAFHQLDLLANTGKGCVPGEGSAFFMLSNKPNQKCYGEIKGLKILFQPKSNEDVENEILNLLNEHNIKVDDLDICLLGFNGQENIDSSYGSLTDGILKDSNLCCFKHLCGEYKTASAFGLWTACQIMEKQTVPEVLKINAFDNNKIENILIYNNYYNSNHSILLLQNVKS